MSGCLSGNFDGPEVGPWECLRLNLGAILGTIGKAELGSGMRKSAQWKLRNHEDEDGQLLSDLKVETSLHSWKSLDSVSSHLYSLRQ